MAIAYVLPFVLYLVLTQIPPRVPGYFPLLYSAVVVTVGGVTFALLRGRQLIRPHRHMWAAAAVGIVGVALWVVLSELKLEEAIAAHLPAWLRPQPRLAHNPFKELSQPLARWSFIAMRLGGLVLLVPIAEELFWRGFLLRWLISPAWKRVELGQFTVSSFAGVTLLFTLAHPEWFAAAVYCALLNGLMYWKRDLWHCIVAHGVSNLVLALYVVTTGTWELW